MYPFFTSLLYSSDCCILRFNLAACLLASSMDIPTKLGTSNGLESSVLSEVPLLLLLLNNFDAPNATPPTPINTTIIAIIIFFAALFFLLFFFFMLFLLDFLLLFLTGLSSL